MATPHQLAISHFKKIGPVTYRALCDALGSAERIWQATSDELIAAGAKENIANEFCDWRATVDPSAIAESVAAKGMSTIAIDEPNYPELLKAIHDPPFVLYYRGTLPHGDAFSVGVVGSRRATDYGLRVAYDLSKELTKNGIIIVSGLAWGIDEAAHKAAIDANGITIAVLACGIDANDAGRKIKLADEIVAKGGCVISEFPPGTPPLTHHFPIRNRIIAGIAKGTLVVEAAIKSGSLITAYAALHENREVFAVPGPITSPTSEGTNDLLKRGAHVVTRAQDILDAFGVAAAPPPLQEAPALSPVAQTIYNALGTTPIHIDDITRKTGLAGPAVASELALMEIQGAVRHLGGMHYIR